MRRIAERLGVELFVVVGLAFVQHVWGMRGIYLAAIGGWFVVIEVGGIAWRIHLERLDLRAALAEAQRSNVRPFPRDWKRAA